MSDPISGNCSENRDRLLEIQSVFSEKILSGKEFIFSRFDGSIICGALTLAYDGQIKGHRHQNEASWAIVDKCLVFLDEQRNPTTTFDRLQIEEGAYVLHGRYRSETHRHLHVLTEKRPNPARLNANIEQISSLISLIRSQSGFRKISVFLIHNVATWDALSGLYQEMQRSNDFFPIVITIPLNFGAGRFHGEEDTHAAFEQMGVPHIRFNFDDHFEGLAILKSLAPDFLFRQAPWDPDIPPAYAVKELSFTKLIYTDYGLGILKDKENWITFDYDQELHRKAWMLLCSNEDQKKIYQDYAYHKGVRAIVTGYPKFDRLVERGRQQSWPLGEIRRGFRLVWAPHHSVRPEWLGFGTFDRVYKDIVQWASENPDIEIVLKPHPMLFESRAHGLLSPAQIDAFLEAWKALPNTAVQTGGDYAPLLSASDAMLTDGISFLAEYQLFDKPLIWLDSGRHVDFNPIGEEIMKGAYRVESAAEIIDLVAQIRHRRKDPLKSKRGEVVRYLMPFPGTSVARTLAAIRERVNA